MRLAAEEDLELVGEAPDASTGIELVRDKRPDLLLIELELFDGRGSDAIREIHAISPETRIIMLAVEADEKTQLEALRAGAAGFLLKSIHLDAIPRVLHAVHAGEAAVSRTLAMRLVEEVRAREG
jgi:DNA-binding NarL/FixJ family response regulator